MQNLCLWLSTTLQPRISCKFWRTDYMLALSSWVVMFPSLSLSLSVCVFYNSVCMYVCVFIGADSTGATGNFATVLTQEPGQTLRFAPVPFMAVFWFFYVTKRAKFAGSVGHPMTKMLSASGGVCPQTPIIGSCSALAMVPPQPLTPSAAYESNWSLPRYLKPKVGASVCVCVCMLVLYVCFLFS